MNKKFILLLLPVSMMIASCSGGNQAKVDMSFAGVSDSTQVVVSRLFINRMEVLDTLYTVDGKVSYQMEVQEGSPEFVYFSRPGNRSISLILLPGDRVKVTAGQNGEVSITDSPESEKMLAVDDGIAAFNRRFDSLSVAVDQAVSAKNSVEEKRLKVELGRTYVRRKQESIRYIHNNFKSLTVIPLLYQKTSNGLPIFYEATDALLMEKVYDSLKTVYPASPYLLSLADEVSSRRNIMELQNRSQDAQEVDFPEIILPDINGVARSLTSFKGDVIALVFWTAGNEQQRQYNVYLKTLYEKYHDRGFEIYQVAMDSDKTSWAMQVKEQALPWVSVCDPASGSVNAAMLYNIQSLPAMYLIDKEGMIVAKDLFDERLESEIRRCL